MSQANRIRSDRTASGETGPRIVAQTAARPPRSPLDGRCGALLSGRRIQPVLRLSSTSDPAEREAERIARQIVSMPEPAPSGAALGAHRSPLLVARAPEARPAAEGAVEAAVEAGIRRSASGGVLLSRQTRNFLEPRFGANFGGVRIHTDSNAANLATRVGARAFTFGRHIFFNEGQYRPDTRDGMELLAHELTHTIQQSETVQPDVDAAGEAPRVTERAEPQASRLGLSDALDYFAGAANAIPGFRMFTILIGFNPINMASVQASPANILRAIVEFLPGGTIITGILDSYGIFDQVGSWIEAQLRTLGISGAAIRAALDRFLDSLGWRDIFDLGGVWRRARAIFADPAARIIAFARSLFGEIMRSIRTAVLRPLARLAERTRGYPLLKAVLGQDPVTGEPFPRTAETVIGGFLTLIGQQELWQNIQRANAIPRAWTWFQGALGGLMSLVRSIPNRFMTALRSLEIMDFVILPRAFATLGGTFGSFLADFGAWALGIVFDLLRIIIEVVKPEILPYLRRAAGAFNTIVRDPVRFLGTLVRAGIQGFRQFGGNFLRYLRTALVQWLTGAMASTNIHIPTAFTLAEIVRFTLSALGLTWASLRSKLVRATSETAVRAMETGFELVRTLVTQGPGAAWQQIVQGLGDLRERVVEQLMSHIRGRIVRVAIETLVTSLNPVGGFIRAIIAIYDTIRFFIDRLSPIGQVAAGFIDSIAAIAAGTIGPAANRVERTMAGLLVLVIGFLARLIRLGDVSPVVIRFLDQVRAPIDRGLDRVVTWIVEQARRAGQFVAQAGVPQDPAERLRLASRAFLVLASRLPRTDLTAPVIARAHDALKLRYALTELTPYQQNGAWFVRAVINPPLVWRLPLPGETAGRGHISRVATTVGAGGEVTAGVVGQLAPGMNRRTAPNFNRTMTPVGALPVAVAHFVQGYRWAHLYGPGFGDEAHTGLMLASQHVNNELQSRGRVYGIEGYARQIRQLVTRLGGRVGVEVVGTSFRDPPPGVPQPITQPLLREVTYTFHIVNAADEAIRFRWPVVASITCAPPLPNGTGGRGHADFRRLIEVNEYLGSRSQATGL